MTYEKLQRILDNAFDAVMGVGASDASLRAEADTSLTPVKIRGMYYASGAEAARFLGLKPNTITIAKQKGKLDAAGLQRQKS